MWNKEVTLGEMSGNKHSFFSAMFIENFSAILAYSYNGAFYLWRQTNNQTYTSQPVIHGHFGSVSDLDWDPTNSFLVTTSSDQTTRIYGYWKNNDTWNEINRPQIHGYDLNAVKCIPLVENGNKEGDKSKNRLCKIVSGADEKVLRTFTGPFNIVKFLNMLSGVEINFKSDHDNQYYEKCNVLLIIIHLYYEFGFHFHKDIFLSFKIFVKFTIFNSNFL